MNVQLSDLMGNDLHTVHVCSIVDIELAHNKTIQIIGNSGHGNNVHIVCVYNSNYHIRSMVYTN